MSKENNDQSLVNDKDRRPYREETAAEIAEPIPFRRDRQEDDIRRTDVKEEDVRDEGGQGFGYAGLIASIIALFVMPVLFGAAGIILGFMARRRGAAGVGGWAIGIGAAAIVFGLFIRPFF
ncbi:DUF4190 domain-containing protein [Bacillus xiapuensis]|uniref:DUF4190 domain-containing protein n=1 Tax=Bacillus xiapuensis TaxID=2014075 RepID=UPI001E2DEEB6|nr:DUF4190 domain-containing protein [Bacillus xiapuensis]